MRGRRIIWANVITVLSAAILIGAEVFGIAFGAAWAVAHYLDLDRTGSTVLQLLFAVLGLYAILMFIRKAMQVEPFISTDERV